MEDAIRAVQRCAFHPTASRRIFMCLRPCRSITEFGYETRAHVWRRSMAPIAESVAATIATTAKQNAFSSSSPAAEAAAAAVPADASRIPRKTYPPLPSKQQQQQHRPPPPLQQPARSSALSELNNATAAAATATAQGLAQLRSMVAQSRELLSAIVASLHRSGVVLRHLLIEALCLSVGL